MTTKELKIQVYHYKDEHQRSIIINKSQMAICIMSRGADGQPLMTNADLTEDLSWKPQKGERYSLFQKMLLDRTLVQFQTSLVYRYTCEQREVAKLQGK